jgi:hypothetical protein
VGKTREPAFTVAHHGKNVHVVDVTGVPMRGWQQWFLIRSDAHHDNAKCRRDLEKKHLDEALKRNAIIIDLGDCLDLMQGKADRRQSKGQLRSGQLAAAYFDRVIEEAAEFYAPYAQNWAFLGQGNHESAWLAHHESCPTTHLVRAIKMLNKGSQMGAGGYGGYLKFRVRFSNNACLTWTMRYYHGSGGGAPMSMGVLDSRRMFSFVEGCDVIAVGHNHQSNVVGIAREYLETKNGIYEIRQRHCDFVRCGTYKDDWGNGHGGWAVEKMGSTGPTPLRAKWLRLHVQFEVHENHKGSAKQHGQPRLAWDILDAQ